MSEEAGKDPQIEESIAQEAEDEDYPEISDQADVEEKPNMKEALFSNEENEAIRSLDNLGFELQAYDETYLKFRRPKGELSEHPYLSGRWKFPRTYIGALLEQIPEKIEEHPTIVGFIIPSTGYVELMIRTALIAINRVFQLESNNMDCIHAESGRALPSLSTRFIGEEGESVKRMHLCGKNDEPCLEISNASPLEFLLYGRTLEPGLARNLRMRVPLSPTLKMDFGSSIPVDRLIKRSEEIARSFIYELDVRNGVVLELRARMPTS